MNIGSLYKVKKYFWLLCPTKETALTATATATGARPAATAEASYWSRRFNCEVTYFSPESYIVFLEEDGPYKKVLTSEGLIGWTCFVESYNDSFEEVETES